MPQVAIFGINVLSGLVAWGAFAARYIRPAAREHGRDPVLKALLTLHSLRFEGLGFLIPGVVAPNLPSAFAVPAAYGDLLAAALALAALASFGTRFGWTLLWVFNIWGSIDLLNAFYQAIHAGVVAGQFGAAYFIVTFIVPLLLVTHAVIFRLLLQAGPARSL